MTFTFFYIFFFHIFIYLALCLQVCLINSVFSVNGIDNTCTFVVCNFVQGQILIYSSPELEKGEVLVDD